MSYRLKARNSVVRRKERGSAVVDFGCGLALLVAVAVPVLFFCANVVVHTLLQSKVAQVATLAADVVDEHKYWLGMRRPGYDEQAACCKAADRALELCNKVGLTNAEVKVSIDNTHGEFDITTCEVGVDAADNPFAFNVLGFDMATLFQTKVWAKGVSCHAKSQPYAMMHMDAPTKEDNSRDKDYKFGYSERDVSVIPVHGFFTAPQVGGVTQLDKIYPLGNGPKQIDQFDTDYFMSMNYYYLTKERVEAASSIQSSDPYTAYDGVHLGGWDQLEVDGILKN